MYPGKRELTDNYPFLKTTGKLKSYACYENFAGSFDARFEKNDIRPVTGIFTEQGELIGIAQAADEQNVRSTKCHFLTELLFNSHEKMEITRIPKDQDLFTKNVYRNVVVILVL